MPPSEKPLKIPLGEPRPYSQSHSRLHKDVLGKRTQLDILNQPKNRVKINITIANIGNLEVNDLAVIQNMITTLQMRLDESYNPP